MTKPGGKNRSKTCCFTTGFEFFFRFQKWSQKVCLMCASTSKKFERTILAYMIKFYNIVMIKNRQISKKLIWSDKTEKMKSLKNMLFYNRIWNFNINSKCFCTTKIDRFENIWNLTKLAGKSAKKHILQKFLSDIFRCTFDIWYWYDNSFFIYTFCAQNFFLRYMHTYGT